MDAITGVFDVGFQEELDLNFVYKENLFLSIKQIKMQIVQYEQGSLIRISLFLIQSLFSSQMGLQHSIGL